MHEGFERAYSESGFLKKSILEKTIQEKDSEYDLFSCVQNSPVLIDIVDGIGLLCILDNQTGKSKIFLLDKTVFINAGVYFNILPLFENCTVTYSTNENLTHKKFNLNSIPNEQTINPKLNINKVFTLFYQEKELGFIFKGEKHDFWELTYVDKGSLNTIVDNVGYHLTQGDMIFYGKNQHHIQWSESDVSVCFLTISFDMDLDESHLLLNKKFSLSDSMYNLLSDIIKENDTESFYSEDLILCYLKEFMIRLLRKEKLNSGKFKRTTSIQHKAENSIVTKSIDFINKNIDRKINVQIIADSIPISSSYLSKIFKKHMDMTLVDYINNTKLEKSKELIRSSNYTFTEIADLLGYSSIHYFSNQFKAKYGVSPSTYEKGIKK